MEGGQVLLDYLWSGSPVLRTELSPSKDTAGDGVSYFPGWGLLWGYSQTSSSALQVPQPECCLPAQSRCLTVWHLIGAQLLLRVWSRLKLPWAELGLVSLWCRGYGVGSTPGRGAILPPACLSIFTWRDWIPYSSCTRKLCSSHSTLISPSRWWLLREVCDSLCVVEAQYFENIAVAFQEGWQSG